MKPKKFKRVVEWDKITVGKNPMTDQMFLLLAFLFMIPIIGQVLWFSYLLTAFSERKVYYIEVK